MVRLTVALLAVMAGLLVSHPADAASSAVTIQNFAFEPTPLTIQIGTTVTWTNQDSTAHTSTSDDSSAQSWSSGALTKGSSYSVTFNQAGTFTYHCDIHPYMQGTIIVQGSATTPTAVPTSVSTSVPSSTAAPTATATTAPTAVSTLAPTSTPTNPPSKKGKAKTIAAKPKGLSFAFSPKSTTIKVGTKVTWVNDSKAPHTITSKVKRWKFNKNLDTSKVSYTFKKAGTYLYRCTIHPGMTGKIVVKKR
jgi:plastocyanin